MAEWGTLVEDLRTEWADVDSIVAGLTDAQWDADTPAEGWNVRDQISHLAYFDEKAELAASRPQEFEAQTKALLEAGTLMQMEEEHIAMGRAMTTAELRDWWTSARDRLATTFSTMDPRGRLPWYGPSMSTRSSATARVMETWAHGQDIADTFGIQRAPTDRLRSVCHIGVSTFAWAYINRGLNPPDAPPRVELTGPSGDVWVWNADRSGLVRGSALDFCLLVTQRRHRADLDLETSGEVANEWLDIAQAFAGPVGPGREPG